MSNFSFSQENIDLAEKILAKYPYKQSAVLPLLDLAQRQNGGWLSTASLEYVADLLEMSYVKVHEVASFYSMFNLKPVGKYHIQVCGTTPCWLNGAKDLMEAFEQYLQIKSGQVTKDGDFSLCEVECLGACIKAPVAQINDDFYENIDTQRVGELIEKLRNV